MDKQFMSGNHAFAEAAIRAGCRLYFGYPITPQNELGEYMSEHLPKAGGIFLQSESETAAISMVEGASATGARVMTSSSSPGVSLKQEGISYLAGLELPAVIVNVMRGGPGLGSISPSQADYFQATRGGGHGDYRTPVYAPESVQEAADLTAKAFDIADKYRTPVMILSDGVIGQMKEPVVFPKKIENLPEKEWALRGMGSGPSRIIASFSIDTAVVERNNWKLFRKYQEIENNEIMYETYMTDDADVIAIAYGCSARIAKGAIKRVRKDGIKAGLIRPITLWPFPSAIIKDIVLKAKKCIVFEMSTGQMVEDVRAAVEGRINVQFHGRPGGAIPTPAEFARIIYRENSLIRE